MHIFIKSCTKSIVFYFAFLSLLWSKVKIFNYDNYVLKLGHGAEFSKISQVSFKLNLKDFDVKISAVKIEVNLFAI